MQRSGLVWSIPPKRNFSRNAANSGENFARHPKYKWGQSLKRPVLAFLGTNLGTAAPFLATKRTRRISPFLSSHSANSCQLSQLLIFLGPVSGAWLSVQPPNNGSRNHERHHPCPQLHVQQPRQGGPHDRSCGT